MSLFIPSGAGIIAKPSGAAAWTPASLADIYSWYDAQDSGTITKDGSNYVTQWNDKCSTGANLTASGTAGPSYNSSAINSKAGLVFASGKGLINGTDAGKDFLRNQGKITVVMVFIQTTLGSGNYFYYWSNGSSGDYTRLVLKDYGSNGRFQLSLRQADGDSRYDDNTSSSYPISANTAYIHRLSIDYSSRYPKQYLSSVGDTTDIENASQLSDGDSVSDTRSVTSELGGGTYVGNSNPPCKIGELLLIRDVLTSQEVTDLMSYLRTKWGFT